MKKIYKLTESAIKDWCDSQPYVQFVSYTRKGSGKHGKVVILILNEKVTVTAACSPKGGAEAAQRDICKHLNRALRIKIAEFQERRKS